MSVPVEAIEREIAELGSAMHAQQHVPKDTSAAGGLLKPFVETEQALEVPATKIVESKQYNISPDLAPDALPGWGRNRGKGFSAIRDDESRLTAADSFHR